MAPRKRSRSRDNAAAATIPPPPLVPPEAASREELVKFFEEAVEYSGTLRQAQERIVALLQMDEARHTWGLTNPLRFPTRYYTREVLEANQPFVRIVEKAPKCAVVNRRGNRHMLPAIVKYVMRKTLSARLVDTEALYQEKNGELTNRPWHLALIEGLRRLTTPSVETVANVAAAEQFLHSLLNQTTFITEEDDVDDDDDDDYVIVAGSRDEEFQDMVIEAKQESKAEPELESESEPEDEADDDEAPSRAESMPQAHEEDSNDFAVKVRFAKSKKGKWYCVLVIGCKHSETYTENSIYQAIKYAVDRGLLNLELFRVLPVHVMVVTDSHWTYGVLDVYGAVKLGDDGKLIYDGFEELQKARWRGIHPDKPFAPSLRTTKAALEKVLERKRVFLRENSRLHPGIDYPAGKYLVADLFMTRKLFRLPKAVSSELFTSSDALLFYEALLRIIVGDRVLTWTKADVKTALKARDSLTKRMADAISTVTEESSSDEVS